MKVRTKLATFTEHKYHEDDHPPTGVRGVYGALECSHCGRVYRDRGCEELDITNAGGWYAAQIDCVCKNRFIQYVDQMMYVIDVQNPVVKVVVPDKKVPTSKYADLTSRQVTVTLDGRDRILSTINRHQPFKNQQCNICGNPFIDDTVDNYIDRMVNGETIDVDDIIIECKHCSRCKLAVVLDFDDAQDAYNNHYLEEEEEEEDTTLDAPPESKYGDVLARQYYDDDDDEGDAEEVSRGKLKDMCCDDCGENFATTDIDARIELLIKHAGKDPYEICCAACDNGYSVILDRIAVNNIYHRYVKINAALDKVEKATPKVVELPEVEVCVSVENDFFNDVDPNGPVSGFFK